MAFAEAAGMAVGAVAFADVVGRVVEPVAFAEVDGRAVAGGDMVWAAGAAVFFSSAKPK